MKWSDRKKVKEFLTFANERLQRMDISNPDEAMKLLVQEWNKTHKRKDQIIKLVRE